ncbi:MAG: permease [Gammaproteobacteria bacterium]
MAVLIAYGVLALVDQKAAVMSLRFFARVIHQVIPALGLVFLFLLIANLSLEPKWITRYLGREAGLKGWLVAIGAGILSIGPIYPWYAMLSDLRAKGMRTAFVAAFLYSRAVKLPLLPLMIHYFGFAYTTVLCLSLSVFAVFNGLIVEKLLPTRL